MYILRNGGITELLRIVGVWCLVRRDMRLAAKAAEKPAREKWEGLANG